MNKYKMILENDKTVKQFFERFYCIPKDKEFSKAELEFLEKYKLEIADPEVKKGANGYIVFRNTKKKLSREEVEKIKNDTGSYREKAEKYNISKGTISKIMNDKY
jgi:DNA invertase Pin-like site-specific DNA recombinase